MAASKPPAPITITPVTAGPRVYPHVDAIGDDQARLSLRLLWDKVHGLTDQLAAANATIKTAVGQVNANTTAAAAAQSTANIARALAQKVGTGEQTGATGSGGTTGGSGGTGQDPGTGTGSGGTTPTGQGPAGGSPVTIDGLSVIINGGSPDVSGWTRSTHLDAIDIGTVTVTFGKQSGAGRWPDVPFGNTGGSLQYTLWIFEQHNGQWYASGIIQFWFGRGSGGANMSCNNEMARNWTYDSRWGPMAGYQPPPGEVIGFMVTAGNQRGDDSHIVAERSNIVFVQMPSCGGPTSFPPYDHET